MRSVRVAGAGVAVVAGAVAIAVAAGCGGGESAEPAGEAAGVECGETATIGFIGPTTGPVASIGDELRKWALFAVERWNADSSNAPKIKVVEGDSQFDPAQASTIAQQFASNSSMLAISFSGSSQEVLAASPIFKKAGFAYVSGGATRATLTNGENPGFFRVVPSDSKQAVTTSDFMVNRLNVKTVFVVDDQTSYSQPLADAVQELLEGHGVNTTRTSVRQNQTDYSSVVTAIPADTDLVYLAISVPAKMQLFGEQMRAQGKRIPLYVGDAGYSPDFHIEGSHFSAFAPDIRNFPEAQPIVSSYFDKFGDKAPLTTYGPPSFVATQVVMEAVARACSDGSATRAEVKQEIARTNMTTSLLNEPIRLTGNGERANASFTIFEIKNGKPVTIG